MKGVRDLGPDGAQRIGNQHRRDGLIFDELKRAQRRLEALDRASSCNHPTGDIEEMLADIARGRDLR